MLVYAQKVPWHFWIIAILTEVLSSRDSEKKGVIVRIKANAILESHVNKLFPTEYTNHDTNQTDKVQKTKVKARSSGNW